jgi:hypothetical protein
MNVSVGSVTATGFLAWYAGSMSCQVAADSSTCADVRVGVDHVHGFSS